jgi:thiol:disulfide interchange protein DsbG
MKLTTLPLIAALTLSLSGCSKTDVPSKAETPAVASASSYELVANTGKGFSVGAMMSAQTVYVLFDPQCPHCGHLWQASLPLHSKARFVWIPIAFNTGKSLSQAAALLTAANPLDAMSAHEQSLLAGTGGMSASADIPADLVKSINSNTQLLNTMGVDSVPYLLAKNKRTGQVVSNNGAMDTPALAQLLGLD